MDREIIVALCTLLGSVVGTLAGILVNTRLVNYRLTLLEDKMDKHNRVIERVYLLERQAAVLEEDMKVVNHRIRDLETDRQ